MDSELNIHLTDGHQIYSVFPAGSLSLGLEIGSFVYEQEILSLPASLGATVIRRLFLGATVILLLSWEVTLWICDRDLVICCACDRDLVTVTESPTSCLAGGVCASCVSYASCG